MRIVAFSDSHNKHRSLVVPDGDILIFGGDATERGTVAEMSDFMTWFKALPHEHKFFVAGNHDFLAESGGHQFDEMRQGLHYLQNDTIEHEGMLIHGSPMTPYFGNWAFMRQRGERLNRYWEMIPDKGVDILIVHGPPYGILDGVDRKYAFTEHVGDVGLRERIREVKPKLFLCGHIHEGQGWARDEHTLYVNTSIMDTNYSPVNRPAIIDYDEDEQRFHMIDTGNAYGS